MFIKEISPSLSYLVREVMPNISLLEKEDIFNSINRPKLGDIRNNILSLQADSIKTIFDNSNVKIGWQYLLTNNSYTTSEVNITNCDSTKNAIINIVPQLDTYYDDIMDGGWNLIRRTCPSLEDRKKILFIQEVMINIFGIMLLII